MPPGPSGTSKLTSKVGEEASSWSRLSSDIRNVLSVRATSAVSRNGPAS